MDDRDTKVYSVDDGNGKEYYVESVTVTPFEMSIKQVGTEKSITNDLVLYVLDAEGKHIDAGALVAVQKKSSKICILEGNPLY